MIELTRLTKRYGDQTAVDDVSSTCRAEGADHPAAGRSPGALNLEDWHSDLTESSSR